MKKREIKNLNLNKKSISNLSKNEVNGGRAASVTITTVTILSCWSCLSCPTVDCTEGVLCDIIRTEDPFK
jgi:hypothetical protein